jgi:hypothetical protein
MPEKPPREEGILSACVENLRALSLAHREHNNRLLVSWLCGIAGYRRHSRTCEAGWIVARNNGYLGGQQEISVRKAKGRDVIAPCAIDELRALL